MSSSSNLPIGWGDRNNCMSEKDIKLGGAAASNFSSKGEIANAYSDGATGVYKTSEEVRAHYLKETQGTRGKMSGDDTASASVPAFWEYRQKEQDMQAKQYGVLSRNPPTDTPTDSYSSSAIATATDSTDDNFHSPQVALVQVATHTLETLVTTLEHQSAKIPMKERAAFADAMKRAMDALAKSG
jgi:hypothetical protein